MSAPPSWGAEVIDRPDPGDLTLYSVTSILNVLSDGDGLTWWAARQAAERAIDDQAWRHMPNRDEQVAYIAKAHDRASDIAKARGSAIHDRLEEWAHTGTRPPATVTRDGVTFDTTPWLDSFGDWLERAQPTYELAEAVVYSPTYGYAGTLDAIMVVDGVRFVADYKTKADSYTKAGKPHRPYPYQVALQLVAYARAELVATYRARRLEQAFKPRLYALSAAEQALAVAVPEVDAGLAIMVTPEHTLAYPLRLDDGVWRAWLHTIESYRWTKHDSRAVMGPALELKEAARADH
jgi:hypothetical protein